MKPPLRVRLTPFAVVADTELRVTPPVPEAWLSKLVSGNLNDRFLVEFTVKFAAEAKLMVTTSEALAAVQGAVWPVVVKVNVTVPAAMSVADGV